MGVRSVNSFTFWWNPFWKISRLPRGGVQLDMAACGAPAFWGSCMGSWPPQERLDESPNSSTGLVQGMDPKRHISAGDTRPIVLWGTVQMRSTHFFHKKMSWSESEFFEIQTTAGFVHTEHPNTCCAEMNIWGMGRDIPACTPLWAVSICHHCDQQNTKRHSLEYIMNRYEPSVSTEMGMLIRRGMIDSTWCSCIDLETRILFISIFLVPKRVAHCWLWTKFVEAYKLQGPPLLAELCSLYLIVTFFSGLKQDHRNFHRTVQL